MLNNSLTRFYNAATANIGAILLFSLFISLFINVFLCLKVSGLTSHLNDLLVQNAQLIHDYQKLTENCSPTSVAAEQVKTLASLVDETRHIHQVLYQENQVLYQEKVDAVQAKNQFSQLNDRKTYALVILFALFLVVLSASTDPSSRYYRTNGG